MTVKRPIRPLLRLLGLAMLLSLWPACGSTSPAASNGSSSSVAQRSLTGTIQEVPLAGAGQPGSQGAGQLTDLTFGPDGNLWFAESVTDSTSKPTTGEIERRRTNGTVAAFRLPNPGTTVLGLTDGPDGSLWFTDEHWTAGTQGNQPTGQIGRITSSGQIKEFALLAAGTQVGPITTGPDGNLWFTIERNDPKTSKQTVEIGRMTPAGKVNEFAVPGTNVLASTIISGPRRSLWFLVQATDPSATDTAKVGRITTTGALQLYPVTADTILAASSAVGRDLVAGPDGNLWFTELTSHGPAIGRMTPAGTVTNFALPNATQPAQNVVSSGSITLGPDGALRFTDETHNAIGRITMAGAITEYPLPTPNAYPNLIVTAPDGTLWFTQLAVQKLGHLS